MTIASEQLYSLVQKRFEKLAISITHECNEVTLTVSPDDVRDVAILLRDEKDFAFEVLIDLCGVDYKHYGLSEWDTDETSSEGFSRGVDVSRVEAFDENEKMPRFAVVYHLLSLALNQRIRLKVMLETEPPMVASVTDIWNSADWFEREAFDLFGIIFDGHPDLRRILTDYGFIGHPFRKDFPLSGTVEMRYDAAMGRVVYEPVSIDPRVLVPRVVREDNRYSELEKKA